MDTNLITPIGAADGDDPFSALTQELRDLDYLAGDVVDGIITFAHPDGDGVLATFDRGSREARLSHRDVDGHPSWMLTVTADVPDAVQRLALYLVLHSGVGDEKAILGSVADAWSVPLADG